MSVAAISPEKLRLHALWCHRIVRASMGNSEFGFLVIHGLARRRYLTGPRAGQCDYTITARGDQYARELF